jgi:hypothetical protein
MEGRVQGVSVASLVVCIAFVLAAGVRAQTPSAIAGTWKLNVEKSTFSPGPAPKSMTVTYTPVKDGVRIRVDVAPAEGAPQHWDMTPLYDGKDYPVHGNPEADTISYKRINEKQGESTMKKNGKVTVVNTRSVSDDGKTLTITMKGTNAQGQPRNDVLVFEK